MPNRLKQVKLFINLRERQREGGRDTITRRERETKRDGNNKQGERERKRQRQQRRVERERQTRGERETDHIDVGQREGRGKLV